MRCFTMTNSRLFFIVVSLLMTQVEGVSFLNYTAPAKIQNKIASICLTPTDITCPNYSDQTNGNSSEDVLARQTEIFLFTKDNPEDPEFLHKCGGHLPTNTHFNRHHRTEMFVHGWLDGVCRSDWMRETKDELFKRGAYNVILIDWTWGNTPEYYTSAANTYIVARYLAYLIRNIMKEGGVGPNNFHLIGHSFGAQIVGFVGKDVPNLRRVTALDPALEPFYREPPNRRLTQTDANLVDVMHTNGGRVPGRTIGDSRPVGDADFYPNGGTVQESCNDATVMSFLKLDVLYGAVSLLPTVCYHFQAVQYYKTSINQCKFVGHLCSSYEAFEAGNCSSCGSRGLRCATMGMDYEEDQHLPVRKGTIRKYYLDTTLTYPYC